MPVTIEDLSRLTGLSRGTIDRVLHDRPNVRPQVRKQVLDAIERTGYQMKRADPGTAHLRVAFLMPPWTDTYFARQIDKGVKQAQREIRNPQFEILVRQIADNTSDSLLREINRLCTEKLDGIILRAENTEQMQDKIDELVQRGIPVMTYDADVPGSRRLCHIGQDMVKSGSVAAGIMAQRLRGYEKAMIITGNMKLKNHKERVDGFCRRLQGLGFDVSNYEIFECGEIASLVGDTVEEQLLRDSRYRFIYMATQSVSGCIHGIRRARRPYPVHVVCNDLTPTARNYLLQGKVDCVIGQAFYQESCRALLLMYRLLAAKHPPKQQVYYTDLSIITRELML